MAIDVGAYSEAGRRTKDLLEAIVETYYDFDYYKDTTYKNLIRPAIFWPDGRSLGYGWASHVSGSVKKFYAKFTYWGFDNLEDFYCLPIEKRNEFLKKGKDIWEEVFRKEEFREKILKNALSIDALDYQRQEETLLALTKAEGAFRSKLTDEARRIENDCYSNRQMVRRILNERARFKAEDKLRERTRHVYGGSQIIDQIFIETFRLQEGIKTLVGFRERFPHKVV